MRKLAVQNRLKEQFPLAEIVNPDSEFNFVKPELIDSLTSNLKKIGSFLKQKNQFDYQYGFDAECPAK